MKTDMLTQRKTCSVEMWCTPKLEGFISLKDLVIFSFNGFILELLWICTFLQVCWCKQLWGEAHLLPGGFSVRSLELQRGVSDACAQEGKQVQPQIFLEKYFHVLSPGASLWGATPLPWWSVIQERRVISGFSRTPNHRGQREPLDEWEREARILAKEKEIAGQCKTKLAQIKNANPNQQVTNQPTLNQSCFLARVRSENWIISSSLYQCEISILILVESLEFFFYTVEYFPLYFLLLYNSLLWYITFQPVSGLFAFDRDANLRVGL